jgi:hypothetical protein
VYALSDEQRQGLIRTALMMVCGGTAVMPLTVPPASPLARAEPAPRESAISVPQVPGRLEFPSIHIERDPFVANSPLHGANEIRVIVPANGGPEDAPSVSGAGFPLVRGIVLGDTPQALVEFGGSIKVVGVGDRLGNETVRSVNASSITLSSGVRLRIASARP